MKKAFTLIELAIVIAIIGMLAAIAIPNVIRARCVTQCANGECSDDCKEFLKNLKNSSEAKKDIYQNYDREDIVVFCKLIGVEVPDFEKSVGLRNYYEEFRRGTLDLRRVVREN